MGTWTRWFAVVGLALGTLLGSARAARGGCRRRCPVPGSPSASRGTPAAQGVTQRRRMRGIAGSFVALAVALGIGLGAPSPCFACSCVAPVSLAEAVARSPDLAVFVGKVVSLEGGADGVATVVVDGRFRGPLFPAVIRARFGGGGDCTIRIEVGERRLFTARLDERGVWFPALCDPQGIQGTPEGDALLAEAIRTFGPAQPVAGQPAPPPTDLPLGLVALALGVVVVLATGLVATLLVAVRR